MADEQAVAKSLADQLVDQKQQLEDNIRQTESQLSCLLYTSPSPRDPKTSRMPSSA